MSTKTKMNNAIVALLDGVVACTYLEAKAEAKGGKEEAKAWEKAAYVLGEILLEAYDQVAEENDSLCERVSELEERVEAAEEELRFIKDNSLPIISAENVVEIEEGDEQ